MHYDEVGRHSLYMNIQLFIRSKSWYNILNAAIFQ